MKALRRRSSFSMRARQSFVSSSDEMARLASAAAASIRVQASGSVAGAETPICAAIAPAPASQVRRLKRSELMASAALGLDALRILASFQRTAIPVGQVGGSFVCGLEEVEQ